VGKSRLVYEFVHSHRIQGWRVLESASVSYGKATPYFPVLDLLKRYAHLEDRDDTRTVRAKVTGQVLTLDETLQETIPVLLWLLDALPEDHPFLTLDPPQRRRRTLDVLKRVLVRESQVQPLLLVFEDLHWIDAETQALLDSLVESLPTAQLLLLVNYRPEYQHGWGSKSYYTQLRLDPLPPASVDAFLLAMLGDDPSLAPLAPLLIARTGGNPFFLEESVRTLVETQMLVGERGSYRLTKPLTSLQVPATVQAVLAARIDRLPPEEKWLLQTAAVIGTEVPFPLLQAIVDVPEDEMHRGLTRLQAAEFLYEARLFPELAYTFKHALTHEVAYGSLLQERRRTLHTHIVETAETLCRDRLTDQVERLAHHAVRGEIWDKAITYLRQAGLKAQSRSANREAVVCFEQALVALEHLPESRATLEQAIDFRLDLRSALGPLGEYGRILDLLHTVEPLAQALGDQLRLGDIFTAMTNAFRMHGDHDRALAFGQRALALAVALEHGGFQARARYQLGQVYYTAGDYRRAMDLLGQNETTLQGELRYTRFGGFGYIAVASRAWLSRCRAEAGAFTEGFSSAEEGLRVAEEVNNLSNLVDTYYGVGCLSLYKGDFHKAITMLERALGLCQTWHFPHHFPGVATALGLAYARCGHLAEGVSLLEQGVEQGIALGGRGLMALWVARLSEGYLLAGCLEDASQRAVQALTLSRDRKQRGYEAYALWLLGEIAAHRNPPEVKPAVAFYRQALALADELGMRPLQAHCHLGLGTLYLKTDRPEPARAELTMSMALYRAMDMTFWPPQTETALAQKCGTGGPELGDLS
jgi:tetratricopeptide (TPR) repeat protein